METVLLAYSGLDRGLIGLDDIDGWTLQAATYLGGEMQKVRQSG